MTSTLSKADYLKKYLSGGQDESDKTKKKKKKKNKEKVPVKALPNVRIIDNDVAFPDAEEEEAPIAINSDDADDIEELPVIASVQDDRDLDIQVKEEFEKSGKWKTFHDGENIARKNLINEVIKLEQSDIKPEPLSGDEYSSEFLYPKKKKKVKKEKPDRQIKQEEDSPPRRRRHDSDESPPRNRHDSDDSPPRRRRHDSDASPPRKRHDSDASPPRRRHDSDASPPRQRRSDSDASPPRRSIKEEADSDASPPRKRARDDDSDMSPPRKNNSDSDASPPRMKKTLDGKKAGLQNARDLKEELLALKRREKKMLDGLSDEASGRNAKTMVRGRLAAAEAKKEEERKKKEVPDAIKQKYEVWNKGVTQVKAASAQIEDNLYEMSKSLTRTVDDTDRETLLKNVEREDDPMAAYMKKKQAKVHGKQRRFPQYKGPQPPANRYGIMPGYRWDGVDRSNGFEKKLLTQGAAKKAEEAEWNRWSAYEGD